MKSLAALPVFLMLATCRYEFGTPPRAVPPAVVMPVGEHGWSSRRMPIRGLEYKQRRVLQKVTFVEEIA